MKHLASSAAAIAVAIQLAACNGSSTPDFEIFPSGSANSPGGATGPYVSDVLRELVCEQHTLATTGDPTVLIPTRMLNKAAEEKPLTPPAESDEHPGSIKLKDVFDNIAFVSYGTVTLDVTNSEGLSPSLSFIKPITYAPSTTLSNMFNLTLAVSGQLNGQQHRNITMNLDWDYSKLDPLSPADWHPEEFGCPAPNAPSGSELAGVLALNEIVLMGLTANGEQSDVAVDPSSDYVTGNAPAGALPGSAAGSTGLSASLTGVFGSQVDFTVTEGVGGGPSWTQLHFKGPGGGSSGGGGGSGGGSTSTSTSSAGGGGGGAGPLSFYRSAKDTLIISFAPACLRNEETAAEKGEHPTTPRMPLRSLPIWAQGLRCCHYYQSADGAVRQDRFGHHFHGSNMPRFDHAGGAACPAAYIEPDEQVKLNTEHARTGKSLSELRQNYLNKESSGAKANALGAARTNNNQMIIQQNVPF